jgi:hypothetical protein
LAHLLHLRKQSACISTNYKLVLNTQAATKFCARKLPYSLHPGELCLVGQLQDQGLVSSDGRLAVACQEARVPVSSAGSEKRNPETEFS